MLRANLVARIKRPGNRLNKQYKRTEQLGVLEVAINRAETAVECIREDHPDHAVWLNNLGNYLSSRYARTRNIEDLEAAIKHPEKAVKAIPQDQPNRAPGFHNLGTHFSRLYERTRDQKDLEAAICCAEAALKASPEDYLYRATLLSNLGQQLGSRYERTRNLHDLEAAIRHTEAAVTASPEDYPGRASLLSTLGYHLKSRYERTGNLQDLEAAIIHAYAAVRSTPEDHLDRGSVLNNLALHLISRYERTGNLQDLEEAISHAETTVIVTPQDHPSRVIVLNNLGSHLGSRYERTGNLQDLEASINYTGEAVKAIPEGYPNRAQWLANLGLHLHRRYERTGNLQDLETAIHHTETAVKGTPQDHPGYAGRLTKFGILLSSRYARTGNLQDLEAAIHLAERAVNATPEDHPDRVMWLNSLSLHLSGRYKRTGNLHDLETAINHTKTAIAVLLQSYSHRARFLNNLGTHLGIRYDYIGNLKDLDASIDHVEAAIKETPEGHPDRAGFLHNLAVRLRHRYERTGNFHNLEAAIELANKAVNEYLDDHPGRASSLNGLGRHLHRRFSHTEALQDLELAIAAWLTSWSIPTAPISTRIQAALYAAHALALRSLATAEDFARASSLLHDATHFIPLATSRSLGREDQQHILEKLTGLASFAAAVTLQAGQSPLEALCLQELGRSVTNGQLLDYRSGISDLTEQYPTLAKHFDFLRQELDAPLPSMESLSDISIDHLKQLQIQQAAIHRRNKAANDLDDILQQIRQKPGFKTFLRAESEEYFLSAAQEGPIVVLNATELRSDAILLTKQQVTSISLPQLSHASVVRYLGACTEDNEVKRELLEWLWKSAVQPVLWELGFYPNAVDPLPRIWWIGVGLLAQAPIHAAAKFTKGTVNVKMTTLQYCLPSYTSTVRALQYSRSQQYQQNSSMLVITMPTTPGESSLSGVTKEADEIKHTLRDFSTVETLEQPTAECVLQALPRYSIVHFACHGVSSLNPADSHLLLLKGTVGVDKLRVKDIAKLKLSSTAGRLAYLSACSTANITSSALVDEVTHIVSSFHIAGFTNVIGTLWPAQDEACHKMAVDFYSTLSKTDNVAVSYRNAILGLMKQKPSQPMYWAPFIHFGA
ncbi:CHAT domain-containing protein [Tirmania nivea]|nr:CHAT domain-containing protein [Tirmania nivea]